MPLDILTPHIIGLMGSGLVVLYCGVQDKTVTNSSSFAKNRQTSVMAKVLVVIMATVMAISSAGWQRSIDNASIITGRIPEGRETLNALALDSWDLVSLFSAFLMRIGLHPAVISLLLSGIRITIFLSGVSLLLRYFGIAKDVALVAASGVVFSGALNIGQSVYPLLVGSSHIHGSVGIGLTVLTLGLFLNAKLGFTVIFGSLNLLVHPLWAFVTFACVALAGFDLYRNRKKLTVQVAAVVVPVLSLVCFVLLTLRNSKYIAPPGPENYSSVETYIKLWDFHRPNVYTHPLTVALTLGLFFSYVFGRSKLCEFRLTQSHRNIFVSLGVGVGLAYLSQPLLVDKYPGSTIVALMPSRVTLLPGVVVVSAIAANAIYLIQQGRIPMLEKLNKSKVRFVLGIVGTALIVSSQLNELSERKSEWSSYVLSIDDCESLRVIEGRWLVTIDTYSSVFRKCRMPVLVDPSGIDFVPYLPNLADGLRTIIQVGYGIEFENPPRSTRNVGQILDSAYKSVWERRSTSDWSEVFRKLEVVAVAVPNSWNLQLTEFVDSNEDFKVYLVSVGENAS